MMQMELTHKNTPTNFNATFPTEFLLRDAKKRLNACCESMKDCETSQMK